MGKEKDIDNRKALIARLTYDLPVLRARLGISQEELAEKIGMSRQSYNAIEKGKREMSWMTFMALVAVFQNNEETAKMLSNIDGMDNELTNIGAGKTDKLNIAR